MPDYDAIVVGAGHNGLSAAVTLAQQGHSVLVLEKTNWPGGMAATKELFKGYKHSVGAWALLIFRDEMIKKLELDQHGFELLRPQSSYCVFGEPEDKPFIGYVDPIDLANHLISDHGVEGLDAFNKLGKYLSTIKKVYDREIFKTPDSLSKIIASEADEKKREILGNLTYSSAMDVMRQFFKDPNKHKCITGSLSASTIDGTHMGPYTQGSALSLAYHMCVGDNYDFKIPKGGIGTLSSALVSVLEKYHAEVRYKSSVKRFLIEDEKVCGVELQNGDTISAKAVISSLDPKSTFFRLAGRENLPGDFCSAVQEIDTRDGYVQIHLTLKELPVFTGHMSFLNGKDEAWLVACIKSPEHMQRCWEEYSKNIIPSDPPSYCYFPSMLDPSLAPAGSHTCTLFSHYFPHDIPAGKHNEWKGIMADRVIDQIVKVAPNFRDAIVDKVVLTHEYFEKTFGATDGDFCHGLVHPGQMFGDRPVPGWANYQTPLENLFMCGAGCHPGPGVTCIPGYNGANAVIAKWKADKA